MIKYTIIIPHFNSPDSLSRLLSTIPKTPEVQVIVIDDNSTADREKLDSVISGDNRCEFYVNSTGIQSAGACRNTGLSYMKGEWVLFADADDYFTDNFYEYLENYYNDPSDVIYFTPKSINISTMKESSRHVLYAGIVKKYLKKPSDKNEINLRYRFGVVWSKMIRREIIIQNNIEFETVSASNDIMFSTRLGQCIKTFQASEKVIYCVTKSTDTLTTTIKEVNLDTRIDVLIRRYEFYRKNLTEKELRQLEVTGELMLFEAFMGFGIKKFFDVIKLLKKNKVKLFAVSLFNLHMSTVVFMDRIGLYIKRRQQR